MVRWIALAAFLGLTACSVDSAKNHYVLAEKLWSDRKYQASVSEFEKVTAKDPHGKLGLQALYRAAVTQSLFLSQFYDAIRKFKSYAESSHDGPSVWDAEIQVGEIYFNKTEQYDQAVQHYQRLIREHPGVSAIPEFTFRIGRSEFFLSQFDEALKTYRDLIHRFPASPFAEKAMYEIGVTYFTRGKQHSEEQISGIDSYQDGIDSFERFIRHYPKSEIVPLARFGIANCLEELDQLDAAYHTYEAIRDTYPSPNIIEVKLIRIRERKAQRNR